MLASSGKDISYYRKDFPQLESQAYGQPLVYLDSAATTLKPRPVIEGMADFYLRESANVHRGAHFVANLATEKFELARESVAQFIGSKSSREIIFTRGTTDAINLVARSYAGHFLEPGDEIVISEMEHHSNIVPWQMIAREKNLKIKVWPITDRGELARDYEPFSERTKMLALVHVSNVLGTINPIKEICEKAKRHGVTTLIDAAQSVPSFPLSVQDLGCDFLTFSGHKCYGPFGVGVLYGREELLNEMPPYQGGGSMISHVTFAESTYLESPQRFEAGTPAIAEIIGLGLALKYINQVGLDAIHQHKNKLLDYATNELKKIPGLRVIGEAEKKTGALSFVIDGTHASDVCSLIDQQGIAARVGHHCAEPLMKRLKVNSTLRASFGFYNTFEEIDKLYNATAKAREMLV